MRKITCMCEANFDAELPDEIDLDAEPGRLAEILSGKFFAITCPNCGSTIKPELDVAFVSRKRGFRLQVLPEMERLAFYLGQTAVPRDSEVLVGYAELFERARILADGLDPETVEIIRYYLRLKAEEAAPEAAEIAIAYAGFAEGSGGKKLLFHIEGMKTGETAVLPISRDYYDKMLADKARIKATEPFDRIFKGQYRSIRILETEAD
jgi:hypothetical protein